MRDHVDTDGEIDYEAAIMLDAEELGEGGVGEAYTRLQPHLLELGVMPPAPLVEEWTEDDSYIVTCAGERYVVIPNPVTDNNWAAGTFALFDIVNRQLTQTAHRFYAINGGNDLFGIFLLPDSAVRAREALARPTDWPYLPVLDNDWGGMHH